MRGMILFPKTALSCKSNVKNLSCYKIIKSTQFLIRMFHNLSLSHPRDHESTYKYNGNIKAPCEFL